MKTKLTIALLLLVTSTMAVASDQGIEATLQQQYKDKVLVLCHPLKQDSPQFDSDGNPIKNGSEGPWTIYGAILIEKVILRPDKLRLEGNRVFVRFDDKRKKLVFYEFARHKARVDPPVKEFVPVEIRLSQPLDSAEQARTILGHVFALSKADLLNSLPEFWHSYLRDNFEYGTDNPQGPDKLSGEGKQSNTVSSTTDHKDSTGEIFRCCKDATAPKPISTPEPEFSEAARYEKFTGVLVLEIVIDKDGRIAHVKIVKPLGLGLDENAVKNVKTWRFTPGVREGQPVALQMNIEVSFNLY